MNKRTPHPTIFPRCDNTPVDSNTEQLKGGRGENRTNGSHWIKRQRHRVLKCFFKVSKRAGKASKPHFCPLYNLCL